MSDAENSGPVRGTGNFLADRGYADPEEARLKFLLANEVALVLEDRKLTQARAAELADLAQADVSRIVNGSVKDYSVFRLMRVLTALGKDIHLGWADAASGEGHILAGDYAGPEEVSAFAP